MMTKSTSQKIAVLKKIAIVPILAGLIYFFCIEVVAKEKIIGTYSKNNNSKITNKDKIRDRFYSGVYVKIIDERVNRRDVTLYEKLSLEDKRKYLDFIPEKRVETEIPSDEFEKLKTENNYVVIDGKKSNKEEIKKFNRNDFSYYTKSSLSIKEEKGTTKYHYALFTKPFFDKNIKNSHLHFTLDTIIIGHSIYRNSMKDKILKESKTDIIVSQRTGSDEYNLYINDTVKKKKSKTIKNESIELNKVVDKKEIEKYNKDIVEKLSDFDPKGKRDGYIYMKNRAYFFINDNNTIEYYNRWGIKVNENGEEIIPRDFKNLNEVTDKPEYLGGIQEFYKYITENFKIPLEISKQKVKGSVFAQFIIEKDGSLSNITILKDMGFGTDEEAKRVLEKCPKWKPGKINNETVRVKYTLPIKLNNE